MAAVGTLNDKALKRKERLKALRERQSAQSDAVQQEEEKETEKLPKPVFRSYKPESDRLKELSIQSAKPEDATKSIKEDMETGQTDHVVTDVDLSNLAPRKPDWDLKRDISKKLDKLERKTQRAIAELIRERLKASQEDLAAVVMGEALTRNNTKNMT